VAADPRHAQYPCPRIFHRRERHYLGDPQSRGSPNWQQPAEPNLRISVGANPGEGRPFRHCGGRRNRDSITAGEAGLEPNRASIGGGCRRLFAACRSPVISDDRDFSLSACLKSLRRQSSAATDRFSNPTPAVRPDRGERVFMLRSRRCRRSRFKMNVSFVRKQPICGPG